MVKMLTLPNANLASSFFMRINDNLSRRKKQYNEQNKTPRNSMSRWEEKREKNIEKGSCLYLEINK